MKEKKNTDKNVALNNNRLLDEYVEIKKKMIKYTLLKTVHLRQKSYPSLVDRTFTRCIRAHVTILRQTDSSEKTRRGLTFGL